MGTCELIPAITATYVPPVFDPRTITGLTVWLDMSDLATLFTDSARSVAVVNDGDVIGGVTDKSGSGLHFQQATAANKPLYKTAIQNGKSVMRFNDTSDRGFIGSSGSTAFTALNVFCVFKVSTFASLAAVYDLRGATGGAGTPIVTLFNNGGNWGCRLRNNANSINTIAPTDTTTTAQVWEQWWNGTTQRFYKSGTQLSTDGSESGTVTVDWGTTYGTVGAYPANPVLTGSGTADLCELLIYNAALSSGDRTSIKTYLGTKYGISVV